MADPFDLAHFLVGGATRPDAISGLQPGFRSSVSNMFANAPQNIQSQLQITSAYRSPQRQAQILSESLLQRHGAAAAAQWNSIVQQHGGDVVAAGEAARPWLRSIGETKWVAPPGSSNHQKGEAIDFKYLDPQATAWAHENAPKYGLNFPMSNEDWHIEPAGLRGGQAQEVASVPSSGSSLNALYPSGAAAAPSPTNQPPVPGLAQTSAPVTPPSAFGDLVAPQTPPDAPDFGTVIAGYLAKKQADQQSAEAEQTRRNALLGGITPLS